jgi:hypothetical protein
MGCGKSGNIDLYGGFNIFEPAAWAGIGFSDVVFSYEWSLVILGGYQHEFVLAEVPDMPDIHVGGVCDIGLSVSLVAERDLEDACGAFEINNLGFNAQFDNSDIHVVAGSGSGIYASGWHFENFNILDPFLQVFEQEFSMGLSIGPKIEFALDLPFDLGYSAALKANIPKINVNFDEDSSAPCYVDGGDAYMIEIDAQFGVVTEVNGAGVPSWLNEYTLITTNLGPIVSDYCVPMGFPYWESGIASYPTSQGS